ncbi:MAG TPA: creatininase family protein [Candidatus Hydrogenedentes bacterium]|nr:creatininase family protein [Candidatus Hydrogenedentota bacterium]
MVERVLYAELTPRRFRQRIAEAPIAYLPLGTLEWHGEHLPLGADGLQSQGFFEVLAREVGGIVLPMLFVGPDRRTVHEGRELYGMDCHSAPETPPRQLDGSAYWIEEELFEQILRAVLKQLARAGFKVVVAHGHGPSTDFFIKHSPVWEQEFGLRLFACWGSPEDKAGLGIQTDHAAANETSLVMALRPELVEMDNLDPDPEVWPLAVGGEDPRTHASPDRGKQAIAVQVRRMAAVLRHALEEIGHGA